MASKDERTRAFNAARRDELKRLPKIQANTIAEVERQLRDAAKRVAEILAGLGDGIQRRQVEALQREIATALDAFQRGAVREAIGGSDSAWAAGIDLVVAPLAAGGVAFAPHLNLRALAELKGALTHLIQDVSLGTIDRINAQLAQVILGTQPAAEAVTQIQRLLGGAARNRARTILYTELGRAYSAASQATLTDATEQLPGLKKRWLRSGKRHPRVSHVGAHGQLRAANEPFVVGGEALMFPRDPKASAKNTINCGCIAIPVTDGSTWGKATIRLDPFDARSKVRIERP